MLIDKKPNRVMTLNIDILAKKPRRALATRTTASNVHRLHLTSNELRDIAINSFDAFMGNLNILPVATGCYSTMTSTHATLLTWCETNAIHVRYQTEVITFSGQIHIIVMRKCSNVYDYRSN